MLRRKRSFEETNAGSDFTTAGDIVSMGRLSNNNHSDEQTEVEDNNRRQQVTTSAAAKTSPSIPSKRQQQREPSDAFGEEDATAGTAMMSKIRRMRLEAIFHPKFDNENTQEKEVRRQMLGRVVSGLGYLEVTLKHSGSLLLWSGGNRFYSKNSAGNRFSMTGEILLRQHFCRAFWKDDERLRQEVDTNALAGTSGSGDLFPQSHFDECSDYVERNRLTLAFEVVTSEVLGDHGERPKRDFLVLTAVADRSIEKFYSTTELLTLAHRFRLPHNDCFVFAASGSVNSLFDFYDQFRSTALAGDVVDCLRRQADACVASMYQHVDFQGDILEGIVIRYVPCRSGRDGALGTMKDLSRQSSGINEGLKDLPDCFDLVSQLEKEDIRARYPPVLSTSVRTLFGDRRDVQARDVNEAFDEELRKVLRQSGSDVFAVKLYQQSEGATAQGNESNRKPVLPLPIQDLIRSDDRETHRIASVIQTLSSMGASVNYSLFQERHHSSCDQKYGSGEGKDDERFLMVIHVYHDRTFPLYEAFNRKTGSNSTMKLFRGFVVELISDTIAGDSRDTSEGRFAPAPMDADTATKSEPENPDDPPLMLKMKFLPYMVRTFGCRNGMSILQKGGGPEAFLKYTKDLLQKWKMPEEASETWLPFFRAWAFYASNVLSLSPQSESTVVSDLPPLSSMWYLDHLDHFERLYHGGKIQCLNAASSSSTFAGLVVVVAQDTVSSAYVANLIKEKYEVRSTNIIPLKKVTPEGLLIACEKGHGIIATATVEDGSGTLRKLLKEKAEAISLVLVGCSDNEISRKDYPEEKIRKKALGMACAWRKCSCACLTELPHSFIFNEEETVISPKFASMIQRIEEVSATLTAQDSDSVGLLVFFPAGMPGCGKSSLVDSTTIEEVRRYVKSTPSHDSSCETNMTSCRNVVVRSGDKVKEKYWRLVTRERLKDKSSVYIADKNAPAPAWDDIANVAAKTKSLAVPVLPELQTTKIMGSRTIEGVLQHENSEHIYPFSLSYLAICASRVLDRPPGTHPGKLDSGTERACLVVIKFFCLYRNLPAEGLHDVLLRKFSRGGALCVSPPLEIPCFSQEARSQLPEDLEAVLIEAVQANYACELQNIDASKNSDHKYLNELEERLRSLLKQYRDQIVGMSVEISTSRRRFVSQLAEIICQSDSLESYALLEGTMKRPSFVKLAAVDIDPESVHKLLQEYTEDARFIPFWENVMEAKPKTSEETMTAATVEDQKFVANTHVTMAHFHQMKQADMKAAFEPLCGSRVSVKVSALLWSDRVAALAVTDVGSDDRSESSPVVPRPMNIFPHITVWHSRDAQARESNDLPSLVESGEANRIDFDDPVELSGVIALWRST